MGNLFLRPLFAAVSLALALPPSWCCLLPVHAAEPAEAVTTPADPCCCPRRADHPEPEREPHERPVPVRECCCGDRDSTPGSRAEELTHDRGLTAGVAPQLADAVHVEPGRTPVPVRHVSSRPLQLLQCVWLC